MKTPLREILHGIRLVILDVDGVMTDGGIIISSDGTETKTFDVQDGSGVTYLRRAGLQVAMISGRSSPVVELRARELGVLELHQGAKEKFPVYLAARDRLGMRDEEVCFVGDDLIDLPVMRRVGLPVAVPNAREEVKAAARYVTRAPGGRGAVREVAELLLKGQGKWEEILERYRT